MTIIYCNDNNHLDLICKSHCFRQHCPFKKNCSVYEAIVPYFGGHSCKQYIRGWRYKLWTETTRLGYIAYFDPYQGSSTQLSVEYEELDLRAAAVRREQIWEKTFVEAYNKDMDGVNRCDQNIAQYRISIRSKEWYFPLTDDRTKFLASPQVGGKLDQLAFRGTLATMLLETIQTTSKFP
ncbi:hypothetical protein ILUMI_22362 [Ignelater luminosus]|uniref:Uncharacterized protein n=1 Tax=Ignelater luminosus TaxID=2038154 RepID=A0A8K0CDY4_IGNLU|nr:hypothetical protein ILUMI_22362 [Ignelater luminosus]